MARRDIVVIGGSAGAIESVSEIVRGLPPDFPAAVFVVVHFPGSVTSALPRILKPGRDPPGSASRQRRADSARTDLRRAARLSPVHRRRQDPADPRPQGKRASAGHRPAVPQRRAPLRPPGDRPSAVGQPERRHGRAAQHQAARRDRHRPGSGDRPVRRDATERHRTGSRGPCDPGEGDGRAPRTPDGGDRPAKEGRLHGIPPGRR